MTVEMTTNILRNKTALVVASGLLLLAGFGLMTRVSADQLQSPDSRLVTIYDSGTQKAIVTKALTVKDALEQAKVTVETADTVEPALTEQLVAKDYKINVYRARPVLIVDGTTQYHVMTAAQTPKLIAASANLSYYEEDTAEVVPVTDVLVDGGAGLKMTIDRAAVFTFTQYGKTFEARTQAKTFGDMLKEKNITLGPNDGASLPLTTPIVAGASFAVWRNGKQTVTVEEAVAKPIEEVKDMNHPRGWREVKTDGKDGTRNVTYEIEMRDGAEVSRKEIASIVTIEPVKEVVAIGAKVMGSYTTPTENQTISWNFLIGKGLTREQAAGIMGNLMQEHRFNTSGDGLAQWTGSRKARLMAMEDPYNIHTQLDFMWSELTGGYSKVLSKIQASTTVEQSTIIFQNEYERCGICAENKRIQYAYDMLATY